MKVLLSTQNFKWMLICTNEVVYGEDKELQFLLSKPRKFTVLDRHNF